MTWLVDEYGYWGVEKTWKVGHETLRKFVRFGDTGIGTEMPHARTLKRYREIFLEFHPLGFMSEPNSQGRTQALPPLKLILPPGEENALAYIEEVFEALRSGKPLPDGAEKLEGWLKKVARAEYSVEKKYPRRRNG